MRVTAKLNGFWFATAMCAVATVLSWITDAPSSCFHLAVVVCSLYGELETGLLSVGLSALSFDYFFISPAFQFSLQPATYPRFAAFVATALCINLVIAAKQRQERARCEAVRDAVGEREAAFASLRKMEERLARAAQIAALGEVSASIAHEINQPLTAMIANAHMCLDSLSAERVAIDDARSLVEEILHCGYHATEVVGRMRTLFKRGAFEKRHLQINDIVNEVISLIQSEAEKRRVEVAIDLESRLPGVCGDRVQIQHVLVNLCINGLDAMTSVNDRRRSLTVRTRLHDPGQIRVEVQDTGVGLQEPDRVFEAFFTTKQNGMGMGLPISRSIIELHNGQLWPRNDTAPGTTFCFTLPAPDICAPEARLGVGAPPQEETATAQAGALRCTLAS